MLHGYVAVAHVASDVERVNRVLDCVLGVHWAWPDSLDGRW